MHSTRTLWTGSANHAAKYQNPRGLPWSRHVAAAAVDDPLGVRHGAAGEAGVGQVLLGEEDGERRRAVERRGDDVVAERDDVVALGER